MTQRNLLLYIVAFITMAVCTNFAAAFNYGDMPTDRITPDGWKNIQWQDPGGWTTIDVTTKGLPVNSPGTDASSKIEAIVNGGSGNRILYFPAGKYYLKSECTIKKNGIRLKGAGMDKTEFIMDAATTTKVTIKFEGSFNTTGATLTADPGVGGSSVQVSSASSYNVGDFVWLDAETFPVKELNGTMHYNCRGQVVKVTSKSGNTLGIDMKMGVSLPLQYKPKAKKVNMVKNVGVEDMKIHRVRYNENSYQVYMFCVQNGFVRNVESSYTAKMHLYAYRCRDIVMHDNYVHHGYDYGAGGNGYGIVFGGSGSRCLAINNTFTILRHDMLYQKGANHCVFAYNTVLANQGNPNSITLHGVYCHNNLIEGNTITPNAVADAAHGMNGPNNWFFRNKCKEVGALHSINKRTCTVGNEAAKVWDIDKAEDFVGANIVGGNMQWNDLSSSSKIPASMFLTSKPSFVAKWPLHGPPASNLPQTGEKPSIAFHPSNVTVSEGETATFTVSASGEATLRYQWYRNGSAMSGKTSATLSFAAAAGDDGASYHCVVTNNRGTAASNAATLTIISGPGGTVTVTSSGDDGNVAANTLDGDLNTRWSSDGDGEWLRFDLGETKSITGVYIAFYKGDARKTTFDIQVSTNGTNWTDVLMGQESSGGTTELEQVVFSSAVDGRYVKITGHGNSANTWNSISEVVISTGGSTVMDRHALAGITLGSDQIRLYDMSGKVVFSGIRSGFRVPAESGIYLMESPAGLMKIIVP